MPHLLVRGIAPVHMSAISESLVAELARICECGTDNFTIECLSTTGVFGGVTVPSFPFVEVSWFDRGQEARNRFAKALADYILPLGFPEFETAFIAYREDSYYVNGNPFSAE